MTDGEYLASRGFLRMPMEDFNKLTQDEKWASIQEEEVLIAERSRIIKERMALGLDVNPNVIPWSAKNVDLQDFPKVSYHVCTAKTAIQKEGLKTRQELGQQFGTGLGGGDDTTISVTTDSELAKDILFVMREAHDIANGQTTMNDLVDIIKNQYADHSTRFLASYFKPSYGEQPWQEGSKYPIGLQQLLDGYEETSVDSEFDRQHLQKAGFEILKDDPNIARRYFTKDQLIERTWDYYRMQFLPTRQNIGGPRDPLFFGSDRRALGKRDPSEIALLKVTPKSGAKGFPIIGMHEWRIWSGKALDVEEIGIDQLLEFYEQPDVRTGGNILVKTKRKRLGGPGSGHKGHVGIVGHQGGSAPTKGGGAMPIIQSKDIDKSKDADYQVSTIDSNATTQLNRFIIKEPIAYRACTGKLSKKTIDDVVANGRIVLENHASVLSFDTRGLSESLIDRYRQVLTVGLADGSLQDVSVESLDKAFTNSIEKLLVQEVESRSRILGDHGIRHVISNVLNTLDILDSLEKGGIAVNAQDQLLAISAQLTHDIGYTAEGQRKSFDNKIHPEISAAYAADSLDYKQVFGDRHTELVETIRTHDGVDIDWDKYPIKSAVRTADNLSLFSREKLPDLFTRVPGALDELAQLQLAIIGKEDKTILPIVKADLHKLINKSNLDKNQKQDLHHAADEVSGITGKFTFGMVAGAFDSFSFSADRVLDVSLVQRPDREILNSLFDLGERQFDKFIKAYDHQGSLEVGLTLQKSGKSVYRLKTKTEMGTSAFSNVANLSIRPLLSSVVRGVNFSKFTKRNRQAVFNSISNQLSTRTTTAEFDNIKELVLTGDMSQITGIRLTQKERDYISATVQLMENLNELALKLLGSMKN
ncbi:MAG: hypothetical protein KKF27_21180 [Gammaproteobacteria bacterium]|nr:hypothetical protein [Gammaproteobacteria bacterium]